jgi:hypothetical protein
MAGSAFAASSPDITSGPKTSTRTLNIIGVGVQDTTDVDANGACNVDPWVDHCSDTSCFCVRINVSKASGNMDKGTQAVPTFFVTIDPDVNPATEPPPGGSGPNPQCQGLLGILTDTATATGETKTLNLAGVSCKKIIAVTPSNPQGNHVSDTLLGAWGISGTTPPSPDASGWGTLSGSVQGSHSSHPNAVSMKLSGLVTE